MTDTEFNTLLDEVISSLEEKGYDIGKIDSIELITGEYGRVQEIIFEGENDNYGYLNGEKMKELEVYIETRKLYETYGERFYY